MDSIRRFIQHTFKDEQTIFGPYIPTENSVSNYSIFNFPFEFTVDVFRGLGKLTKRSKPRPKLTKAEQKPQVIYIEKPVCQPDKSPAELMRELNAEHEAKLLECEKITDCCLRERTKALIEIDYRKRLAQLASSSLQCGNEILQEEDGDTKAPDDKTHSRVNGKSRAAKGRNPNMDGGTR